MVNAIDIEFTPSVDIFNQSYIEIQFPEEIIIPLEIESTDQLTDDIINDPWLPIPCETIMYLDENLECFQGIDITFETIILYDEEGDAIS